MCATTRWLGRPGKNFCASIWVAVVVVGVLVASCALEGIVVGVDCVVGVVHLWARRCASRLPRKALQRGLEDQEPYINFPYWFCRLPASPFVSWTV